jgi:hypothetical protein
MINATNFVFSSTNTQSYLLNGFEFEPSDYRTLLWNVQLRA